MRYIGGKSLLVNNIIDIIEKNTTNANTIIDIFAGSGVVSCALKNHDYNIISNDFMYFSYVLARGTLCLNKEPIFSKLNIDNPINHLNNLTLENTKINIKDCFIYNNYSPNKNCNRMYFQNKNAIKIDLIRITIENWLQDDLINEDEYFYLLAILINAVPYVANITGVYAAYLKNWDKRTYNDLLLKKPTIISNNTKCSSFNDDFIKILQKTKGDILYADPPYNERQYLPNYHILETIAKYDNPKIKGITGMRDYSKQKSQFCQKKLVQQSFEDMIKNANVKYIIISYNNEGLYDINDLIQLCKKYAKECTFRIFDVDYRRYKSNDKNSKQVKTKEYILFFEKEQINEQTL